MSSAIDESNKRILERIHGLPSSPGTAETDSDPRNPNKGRRMAKYAATLANGQVLKKGSYRVKEPEAWMQIAHYRHHKLWIPIEVADEPVGNRPEEDTESRKIFWIRCRRFNAA